MSAESAMVKIQDTFWADTDSLARHRGILSASWNGQLKAFIVPWLRYPSMLIIFDSLSQGTFLQSPKWPNLTGHCDVGAMDESLMPQLTHLSKQILMRSQERRRLWWRIPGWSKLHFQYAKADRSCTIDSLLAQHRYGSQIVRMVCSFPKSSQSQLPQDLRNGWTLSWSIKLPWMQHFTAPAMVRWEYSTNSGSLTPNYS